MFILHVMLRVCCFIVVFILCACNNRTRGETPLTVNNDLYVVDIDHADRENIVYSAVFGKLKTVVLGANDSVLIGEISKMQVGRDGIFVLDRNQTKGVYLFSSDGAFVRRFGSVGNGPGEYIAPFDFSLDQKNDELFILDGSKQRINKYDIGTGKFIGYITVNPKGGTRSYHIQYNEGALFADAFFGQSSKESYLLQKIDTATGVQQNAYLNNLYNQRWENLQEIEPTVFYSVDRESSRFVERFMDTVIYVSSKEVKPYLVVKTEKWMRAKDWKKFEKDKMSPTFLMTLFSAGKIFGISDYIEKKGSFIYFGYYDGRKADAVVYHVKTKETKLVGGIKDDLLFKKDVSMTLYTVLGCATDKGVYFYDNNPSGNLKSCAVDGVLSPKLDNLDELKQLDENSNPVIFYYEYKN
jgi:hypothetical protein